MFFFRTPITRADRQSVNDLIGCLRRAAALDADSPDHQTTTAASACHRLNPNSGGSFLSYLPPHFVSIVLIRYPLTAARQKKNTNTQGRLDLCVRH